MGGESRAAGGSWAALRGFTGSGGAAGFVSSKMVVYWEDLEENVKTLSVGHE